MTSSSHIFLTGGTGFFGRALLRTWLMQQSVGNVCPTVTVLTRAPGPFLIKYPEFDNQPWLHLHTGNICEPHTLPKHKAFTHVLHAAADSTFSSQLTPLERYDQIVSGTRNLLNFSVASGAQRFLLTSSGAVYGPQPAHMDRISEDCLSIPDPLNPNNAYGIAKRCAEHLCALYLEMHGLQTVIARCFAFVGQDLPLNAHFAIGNFIRDALWREEIVVGGDGTQQRSYLDQQDLAHWLLTLLEHGLAGGAYNVGSDQAISISELAYLVRDVLAPDKPVRILGEGKGDGGRNRYIPDIQFARKLGLEVCVSLKDAIKRVAQSYHIKSVGN